MQVDLEHPEYLPLLALLPVFWWLGWRSWRPLGRVRSLLACGLRSLVVLSLVAALSGLQLGWDSERVSVVYVLDQSDSIPESARARMLDYAVGSVRRDRDARRGDLAGVVVFGGQAQVEAPPYEDELPGRFRIQRSQIATDATDLASAIQLAVAMMPPDTRRRIVLVSDGNQTRGDANEAALSATRSGIGIDVVPVAVQTGSDVTVERLDVPTRVRVGQPFEGRVVLSSSASEQPGSGESATIRGTLTLTQSTLGTSELVFSRPIELSGGTEVISFRHEVDRASNYSYEAEFVPAERAQDLRRENNVAGAFASVQGDARVLLIEPWDHAGAFESYAQLLREQDVAVDVQPSNATFTTLAELLSYDSVILADVPRTLGDSTATLSSFSDAQIEMLVRNTEQFGAGLLMIGGTDSFGAGGWSGTRLEEVMPVDFDVKNSRVQAVGALMLVIDSSGSMSGEKIELCKSAAAEAVRSLRSADYVGVITFDAETHEIVPLRPIGEATAVQRQIQQIAPGGGTDLYPAMSTGYRRLAKVEAMVKHMIVLTDGQTQPAQFDALATKMKAEGMTVSAVGIGGGADEPLLRRIAGGGGGKYYRVRSPRSIPQIVMRESRRVSKPLIYEDPGGLGPQLAFPHSIASGIGQVPAITGYVLTTPKSSPLVQNVLMAPKPGDGDHPVLSVWQYGLGRTAALTTDVVGRWTADWLAWPDRSKFHNQLVRWLMRPAEPSDKFSIASVVRDGRVEVVVNALGERTEFQNFLEMQSSVIGPDLEPLRLELRQTGPGRYAGSFPAEREGTYFIRVQPQDGAAPLVVGAAVPSGAEYRVKETNTPLLQRLAESTPEGGQAGELTSPLQTVLQEESSPDHFRGGLASNAALAELWPWAVLFACWLFLADVAVRRIDPRLLPIWSRLANSRRAAPAQTERLDRLEALRRRREAGASPSNWAPATEAVDGVNRPLQAGDEAAGGERFGGESMQPAATRAGAAEEEAEESYVERLLEAKRRAKRSS